MASDPWAKYSQQYWGEQFRSLTGAKLQNPTEHSKRLIAQLGLDSFQVPDAQKHLAAQLGLIDRLGLMDFKATDYLQQINLQLKAPHQYTDFLLQQRTLTEQAILPLSNTLALIENINQRAMSQMKAVFENINQALATAKYIATLELSETHLSEDNALLRPETDEGFDELINEGVPESTISQLQQVDFLPLRLLHAALRNPELMKAFQAREFEQFIACLIEQLGFEDVLLTPRSGDQGRDVLATKRVYGIPILFAFECKRYKNAVGPDIMRALLGTTTHRETRANKGVLVTTSTFSPGAQRFILTEPSVEGRDFDGIVDWLREYATKKNF